MYVRQLTFYENTEGFFVSFFTNRQFFQSIQVSNKNKIYSYTASFWTKHPELFRGIFGIFGGISTLFVIPRFPAEPSLGEAALTLCCCCTY
jgi:hypothetical protein